MSCWRRAMGLLVAGSLAAGCTDRGSVGDTATPADGDCAHTATSPGERIAGLVIEHDLAEGAAAWVSFSVDGATYESPRQETAGSVKHIVLGPKPGQAADYTLHIEADGAVTECAGSADVLPIDDPDLPAFSITAPLPDALTAAPYFFGATLEVDELSLVFMINRDGDFLFARWGEPGFIETIVYLMDDGSISSLRISLTHDPALTYVLTEDVLGETSNTYPAPAAHHDIATLPSGNLAVITSEARDVGGTSIMADTILEYAPDGSATTLFSLWDHYDPRSEGYEIDYYQMGEDWSHGNEVGYYPENGTVLFSIAQQNMVLEIDPATGDLVEQYGGLEGVPTDDKRFTFQHNPVYTGPDTMMLSTKGNTPDGDPGTGAIEYRIASDGSVMEEIWGYVETDTNFVLGQNQRLSNGNTFVIWGQNGFGREVTPAGEIAWTIESAENWFLGRVTALESPYPQD